MAGKDPSARSGSGVDFVVNALEYDEDTPTGSIDLRDGAEATRRTAEPAPTAPDAAPAPSTEPPARPATTGSRQASAPARPAAGSSSSAARRPAAGRDRNGWVRTGQAATSAQGARAAEGSAAVTGAASAALAAVAPGPSRTWTVADAEEPPQLPDPNGVGPRGARVATVAAAVVAAGVLAGFGWMIWAAWQYVTTTPDAAQQVHWEQLRGLIDAVTAILLLVVGTVLGASLQSRFTSTARAQAAQQAAAAAAQREVARRNAEAARANASAALTAADDLARAIDLLTRVQPLLADLGALVAERDATRTQFVAATTVVSATRESHVAGYRVDRSGDVRLAEVADEAVDRRLGALAVRSDVAAEDVAGWLSARR